MGPHLLAAIFFFFFNTLKSIIVLLLSSHQYRTGFSSMFKSSFWLELKRYPVYACYLLLLMCAQIISFAYIITKMIGVATYSITTCGTIK